MPHVELKSNLFIFVGPGLGGNGYAYDGYNNCRFYCEMTCHMIEISFSTVPRHISCRYITPTAYRGEKESRCRSARV